MEKFVTRISIAASALGLAFAWTAAQAEITGPPVGLSAKLLSRSEASGEAHLPKEMAGRPTFHREVELRIQTDATRYEPLRVRVDLEGAVLPDPDRRERIERTTEVLSEGLPWPFSGLSKVIGNALAKRAGYRRRVELRTFYPSSGTEIIAPLPILLTNGTCFAEVRAIEILDRVTGRTSTIRLGRILPLCGEQDEREADRRAPGAHVE